MDFNQVSARGLKRMMRHIMSRADALNETLRSMTSVTDKSLNDGTVDVVLIGHSKTFVPYNKKTLEPFLRWVSKLD